MILIKKAKERSQLNLFRNSYNGFPKGSLQNFEKPDFIVDNNKKRIGIELTDLYNEVAEFSTPLQKRESLKKKILDSAMEMYQRHNLPKIKVTVSFNDHYLKKIDKNRVEKITKMLVNFLINRVPKMETYIKRDFSSEEIFSIEVLKKIDFSNNSFTAIDYAYITDVGVTQVENVLQDKNEKFKNYKGCDEYWLVICYDGPQLSRAFYEVTNKVLNQIFVCKFNKLFLLKESIPRTYELKTKI